MAAIPIQDDANVARHRLLFKLIEEPALVNPIQPTEEQRRGRAFVWARSLRSLLPGVEPGKGSLFVKGYCARAFAAWAPIGLHLVYPNSLPHGCAPKRAVRAV